MKRRVKDASVLDKYVSSAPSHQNALDLFAGLWSSTMPKESGLVAEPGTVPLFEDSRITWANDLLGFADASVLELGPLEGGHSYMLQQLGAREVLAIEANSTAFLRCLCVKEIFALDRVRFRLGDFRKFLEVANGRYDVVLASGILYHMAEPLQLLHAIAQVTDKLMLWTHYFDEGMIRANPLITDKFGSAITLQHEGVDYEGARQEYLQALEWGGFCGGGQATSVWLTKASILKALQNFGFPHIEIGFDRPDQAHGPAMAVCASRLPLSS